jgi:hypothetical protein
MKRGVARWLAGVVLAGAIASARPAEAAPIDDVMSMIAAAKPAPEIVEYVHAHKGDWLPRHVYQLVDAKAPPDVIRVMAAHAVVFYDGTKPRSLEAVAASARVGMAPQTIKLTDFVVLFEWFADLKTEIDQLRASVPALKPQAPGETTAQYDVRKRTYDEDLIYAVTPAEGKIDLTTFDAELPALFAPDAKGCAVGTAEVPLDQVNYFTFRTAMGTTNPRVAVAPKKSRSIAGGEFYNGETKYFRITSKPACGEMANSLIANGGKAKIQLNRTAKGGDWTAAGEFTNKNGETIPASR